MKMKKVKKKKEEVEKRKRISIYKKIFLISNSYGDIVPHTQTGRMISLLWLLFGVIMGSIITATFTNAMFSISSIRINGKKVRTQFSSSKFFLEKPITQSTVNLSHFFRHFNEKNTMFLCYDLSNFLIIAK